MISVSTFLGMIQHLGIFSWKDSCELLFLCSIIYFFSRWLAQDKQSALIYYFYGYCFAFISTFYLELSILNSLFIITSPAIIMFFVLIHQETLQKHFIMFKRAYVPPATGENWLDEFIRGCLRALNNNKEIICIVERSDSLQEIIQTNCIFHAELKKDIFDILLEKHSCSTDSIIWINQEGKIVAINASFKNTYTEEWITDQVCALAKWKQDGIFITSKTDALIIHVSPLTRSFSFIIQGKLAEHISPEQALILLRSHLAPRKKTSLFNTALSYTKKHPEQTT